MSFLLLLELTRFVGVGVVLGVAALQDWLFGEVKNRLWLYTPVGLVLWLLELWLFLPEQTFYALPIMAFMACLPVGLFFLCDFLRVKLHNVALQFGGADMKALVMLSLACPFTPMWGVFGWVVLPMLTFFVAALVLVVFHRRGVVRFLPYLFVGFLIAII